MRVCGTYPQNLLPRNMNQLFKSLTLDKSLALTTAPMLLIPLLRVWKHTKTSCLCGVSAVQSGSIGKIPCIFPGSLENLPKFVSQRCW